MTPSLCDICADPVEDGARRCDECAAEISEQLARMMGEPPTAGDVLTKPRPAARRSRGGKSTRPDPVKPEGPPTDDEVLRWWELYDEGYAATTIAGIVRRSRTVIERHLRELGVWEGTTRPRKETRTKARRETEDEAEKKRIDALIKRMLDGTLREPEANIAAALARINIPDEGLGSLAKVAYARSMQHVKAGARAPVIQSERQRRNSAVGGKWRSIIRMDLRRAGLLP